MAIYIGKGQMVTCITIYVIYVNKRIALDVWCLESIGMNSISLLKIIVRHSMSLHPIPLYGVCCTNGESFADPILHKPILSLSVRPLSPIISLEK